MSKAEYQRQWHIDHKEERLPKIKQQRKDRANLYRERINEIKNVPCVDCGIRYPSYVMDFDHQEPKHEMLKPKNKSKMGLNMTMFALRYGWNKLLEEIAKCEIVCANCHRIRTHK